MSPTSEPRRIDTDFLIIGGGIAGYQTAINLLPLGSVTLASRGSIASGSSYYAQGGLALPWGFNHEAVESHVSDTLRAGAGFCDAANVKVLVEGAEEAFATLVSLGVPFDRDSGGDLLLTREAAHSRPRIIHAGGDKTGSLIVKTLAQNVHGHERFSFLTPFRLHRLLKDEDSRVVGGLFMGEEGEDWISVRAGATILATGGFSALFARTTNPPSQVGDATAVASQAGARLERLAFTQFHPTVLDIPGQTPFLLTEALRGEGGHIVDQTGRRILYRYHPDGELAPRDVVSRSLWLETRERPDAKIFLSVAHLSGEYLRTRFPQVYYHCLDAGIDLARDPAPIRPAAHFQMGGVRTDMDGRTDLPGLYAVGEVASTRVHGANRLASNSLLEALVMGHRVVRAIAGEREGWSRKPPLRGEEDRPDRGWTSEEEASGHLTLEDLKTLLWEKAGIVRTSSLVASGKAQVAAALEGGKMGKSLPKEALLHNALTLARLLFEDLETAPRVGSNYFLEDGTPEPKPMNSAPGSGS
ncbi:MAG: FAD-dependent oxidoreductase [Nitrospiraceae bacterium]|jgi:L-aspartate oxidase|nr:FAD-dependent oxidoreductase [Nitrospiraceae bacterium]